MKRLILTLSLLAIIGISAVVWFIVHLVHTTTEVEATSKAYVEAAVPAISSHWSVEELLKRSSPELKSASSRKEVEQLFGKLSELGGLKEFDSGKGQGMMMYTGTGGSRTTIGYLVHAVYENEKADLDFKLIRREGDWQIIGFHVNSPIFLRKSEPAAPQP